LSFSLGKPPSGECRHIPLWSATVLPDHCMLALYQISKPHNLQYPRRYRHRHRHNLAGYPLLSNPDWGNRPATVRSLQGVASQYPVQKAAIYRTVPLSLLYETVYPPSYSKITILKRTKGHQIKKGLHRVKQPWLRNIIL